MTPTAALNALLLRAILAELPDDARRRVLARVMADVPQLEDPADDEGARWAAELLQALRRYLPARCPPCWPCQWPRRWLE